MRAFGLSLRSTRAKALLVLAGLPLLLSANAKGGKRPQASSAGSSITISHGYAVFGQLKYPPNWTHFDYTNPNAPKGGTFRYANSGTFDSVNYFSILGSAPFTLTFTYDSLMQRSLDEPASYYGLLAETIRYPKDFAWVEFKMRPQARWHDGKPVTPEDVIFTVEAFRGMVAPAYRRISQSISKIEKTGSHSVRVTFVMKGNPTLPSIVAQMPILPKHYYAARDFTKPTLTPPLVSGPYRVGRVVSGRWLELVRAKNYWARDLPINRGRFNYDIVRYDFYRDPAMADMAFLNGQADLRPESNPKRWAAQDRLPAFRAKNILRDTIPYDNGASFQGIAINTRLPKLSDRRVRQAVTLAYDFEWMARVVLGGHHGRLTSYFANTPFSAANSLPSKDERVLLEPFRKQLPSELFTSKPSLPIGGDWASRRRNIIAAAALLRQAGYKTVNSKLIDPHTGRQMTLALIAPSVLYDRQTSLFLENLRALGIDAQYRAFDNSQYLARQRSFDYEMIMITVFAPLPAPGLEMQQAWSAKAASTPNSTNYAGVKSSVVDSLVNVIGGARDRATVVAAMRALDRVALWNYYMIPVQHISPAPVGEMPIAYWNKFGRPPVEPTYYFPARLMEHWWVDKAREAKLRHGDYAHR